MRFVFRGIGMGLLAGTFFFFFPFAIRFIFFAFFVFFIVRLVAGRGWRRRRFYGPPSFNSYDRPYEEHIISIDGRGYVPPVQSRGPERNFPIQ